MHSMYASCLLQCLSETVGILFALLGLGCVLGIIGGSGAYSPPQRFAPQGLMTQGSSVCACAGSSSTYVKSFSLHGRCK